VWNFNPKYLKRRTKSILSNIDFGLSFAKCENLVIGILGMIFSSGFICICIKEEIEYEKFHMETFICSIGFKKYESIKIKTMSFNPFDVCIYKATCFVKNNFIRFHFNFDECMQYIEKK